jgi:hypothetical protein
MWTSFEVQTKGLSSTGSTVSSRHESWPFAYDAMAYGLVDDADPVRKPHTQTFKQTVPVKPLPALTGHIKLRKALTGLFGENPKTMRGPLSL